MIVNRFESKNLLEDLLGSRARVKILKSLAINEELTAHLEYLNNTTQLLQTLIEYTKTLEKRISILEERVKT